MNFMSAIARSAPPAVSIEPAAVSYHPPFVATAGRLQGPEPALVTQVKARFVRETDAALSSSCFAPDAVERLHAVVAAGNPDRLADAIMREMSLDAVAGINRIAAGRRGYAFDRDAAAVRVTVQSVESCLRDMRWRELPDRRAHGSHPLWHKWRPVLDECRALFPWPEAQEILVLSGMRLLESSLQQNFFQEFDAYWRISANTVSAGMALVTRRSNGFQLVSCVPTSIDRYLHDRAGVALLGCPVWGRVSNRLLNALHAVGYRAEAHAVTLQRYDEDAEHHPCKGLWHDRSHRDQLNCHSPIWTTLRSVFLEAWYQYYPWYAQLCQAHGEPLVPLSQVESEMRVNDALDGAIISGFYKPTIGLTVFEEVPAAMAVYRLTVAETYLRAAEAWHLPQVHPGYTATIAQEHHALREQLARKAPELLALVPIWLANPHVFDPMTM